MSNIIVNNISFPAPNIIQLGWIYNGTPKGFVVRYTVKDIVKDMYIHGETLANVFGLPLGQVVLEVMAYDANNTLFDRSGQYLINLTGDVNTSTVERVNQPRMMPNPDVVSVNNTPTIIDTAAQAVTTTSNGAIDFLTNHYYLVGVGLLLGYFYLNED